MPLKSPHNEEKLLLELSQGSETAYTILYNEYKHIVYSAALKVTKSKVLAEEAVQDIFLKIWENHQSLPMINNFENYLFIVARNSIFFALKKINSETISSSSGRTVKYDAGINDTDYSIKDDQYNIILQQIVEQLPPQQQKIYKMAKWEGLSHQKIGENLNISTATVKKHMAQALKFIRAKISPYINIFFSLALSLIFSASF